MPAQKPGRSRQTYRTPKEFLHAVEERFGSLTFDLAATSRNTVVPKRFYSPANDSLSQSWSLKKVGPRPFLNPPFGNIEPWAKKCATTTPGEFSAERRIFFLIPASVGSNWYRDWVHSVAAVYFLSPRLSFDGKAPFPKDLMLAVYGGRVGTHECWRWKP
jgi:phage N-6-adenine-methyltransferase